MEEKALVFDIQRYSVHDGPGIRTLVFLKGCLLKCEWCSNPDGISPERQIKYRKAICIGCGKCLECPEEAISVDSDMGFVIDRESCTLCGLCINVCTPNAKQWAGELMTTEDVFKIVKRDKPFFGDDGGLTIGGGECMLHPQFVRKLLELCRDDGITTAIETAGGYSFENLKDVVPLCDTIFYDIKGWDEDRHMECTGGSAKAIRENLKKLNSVINTLEKKPVLIIRVPVFPGYNITQVDMDNMAAFFNQISNLDHVELLPFHNLGSDKYEQLGMDYLFKDMNNLRASELEDYSVILGRKGVRHKVVDW